MLGVVRPRLLLIFIFIIIILIFIFMLILLDLTTQLRPHQLKRQKLPPHTPTLHAPFPLIDLQVKHRLLLTARQLMDCDLALLLPLLLLGMTAPQRTRMRVLNTRRHREMVYQKRRVLQRHGEADAHVWSKRHGAADIEVRAEVETLGSVVAGE
ncbi:uncharacterized protein LDX57_004043 [Aspergillus melleus]|uniref:uncharacterized protein n=1 Tax=Aspergillus melleus TaxID=138277 RepID=UPI001E8CDEA8|nr:uncharacterized protein LDX57_004043 [Aspergillus melleus]KAH8426296.1 hypothetical protein LDX57_004043 [Aspergillus melleus]